jgi:pimeloyl-ACP methyl ester carboxylesterase
MRTTSTLFLHGLDSSSQGTKGCFFKTHFPHVIRPDFTGDLEERLQHLEKICAEKNNLTFIGTSFGGLMAAFFALKHPKRVANLILLAPALNYEDYHAPEIMLTIPTILIIGQHDTVTPAELVIPLAEKTFSNLDIRIEDDDHMLHNSFKQLDWKGLIGENQVTADGTVKGV